MMEGTRTASLAAGLRYGLLGLPLAFVALPLYVHLPQLYAHRYGTPLTTLGLVLLLARLLDAFTDPWLGRFSDGLINRSPRHLLGVAAMAVVVLLTGVSLLFFPPWDQPDHPAKLLLVLVLSYLAYSLLVIAHQSWGTRMGGSEVQRARIVAWREGAGLAGVVLASLLPAWLGWGGWIAVLALTLVAGWLAWASTPAPRASQPNADATPSPSRIRDANLFRPWHQQAFRRLLAIFVLNGLASAMPATLILFFVQDRLGATALQPLFLATYFLAAVCALPLWLRTVKLWGLAGTWLAGMLLAVTAFAGATATGNGDVWGFWIVCALSGLALGTDLAMPGALLTGVIADCGDQGSGEGTYLGWWNLASKLNLALAAGLALPLLELLGYQPGNTAPDGLRALTLAYAVIPCALKLLAAASLYYAWMRRNPPFKETT